jgi:hypothetical protein
MVVVGVVLVALVEAGTSPSKPDKIQEIRNRKCGCKVECVNGITSVRVYRCKECIEEHKKKWEWLREYYDKTRMK